MRSDRTEVAEKVARAVLYEGYLLYPYTRSSTKNRQRWTFGGIYPKSYVEHSEGSDLAEQQTECLIMGTGDTRVSVTVRFLQLVAQNNLSLNRGLKGSFDEWEEAVEREVSQRDLSLESLAKRAIVRSNFVFQGSGEIHGSLEISADRINDTAYRLRVRVINISEKQFKGRSEALLHSLISTHALLSVRGKGEFISLLDPPPALKNATENCKNIGTWPVLVGEQGSTDMMLSSPIILYDYPQIAPESPGDLFDGAEIDEILSLRILTLSEEEKRQVRDGDERGRELLERTENLSPDDLLRLHGRLREIGNSTQRTSALELKPGTRVRINPKKDPQKSSDIFDVALKGMTAVIESVEQDFEGTLHIAVTLDDDPGRDLGRVGQIGHRFFFKADELEFL
jgi:hypothetical protein